MYQQTEKTISKEKIIDCFGDLKDPDSNRIFTMTSEKLLSSIDHRVRNLLDKIAEQDVESIAFQAHQLKGSFSTMGATELAFLCHELEHGTENLDQVAVKTTGERIAKLSLNFKKELEQIVRECAN
jgi:HPt (histidine-containing phosphotransfer) domain-containing protein